MNAFAKKAYRKVLSVSLNNPFVSWLLIVLSKDYMVKRLLHQNEWQYQLYKKEKSKEENVGYSAIPQIQKLLLTAQTKLVSFANSHLKATDPVLEIGCGTGVILKSLEPYSYTLFGLDLSKSFLQNAQLEVPSAQLFNTDYLQFESSQKYKFIYCYSVLMYIEPSRIVRFFNKVYDELQDGGYAFFQYHHALTLTDLFYPDLTYIKYSPHRLEKIVSARFNIIASEHFYDGRKINRYDSKHYYFPDDTNTRLDTIENTCLLIIQKK